MLKTVVGEEATRRCAPIAYTTTKLIILAKFCVGVGHQ